MNLSVETALFALAYTEDPEVAAQMADLAGSAVLTTDAHPRVSFPQHWVLRMQRKDAKWAAYAVRYCTDPETLALVAGRARRVTVGVALARNPYLTNASAEVLAARLPEDAYQRGNNQVYQALRRRTLRPGPPLDETLAAFTARARADESLWATNNRRRILELLALETTTPAEVDQVIGMSTACGYAWLVADALVAVHQEIREIDRETRGVRKTTLSATALVERIPPAKRVEVLHKFLGATMPRLRLEKPIGIDLTRRLCEELADDDMPAATYSWRRPIRVFDDESIEFLSHIPGWAPIIRMHSMSDEQFDRVVAALPEGDRFRLFEYGATTRGRLETLITRAPEHQEPTNSFDLDSALQQLTGPTDPLVARLMAALPVRMRIRYLGGSYSVRGAIILPPLDAVPDLVAQCRDQIVDGTPVRCFSYVLVDHPDYTALLADLVPGFARSNLRVESLARHVFAKLAATGAPLDLALSQLESCTTVGLNDLCTALTNMAKLHA